MSSNKQAFIIRCNPNGINKSEEVREESQIVIGWAQTKNKLLDLSLDREGFKKNLKDHYEYYVDNSYSLGQATGYLWRFIREMKIGDYVLVPISKAFYLGEVRSDVMFLEEKVGEDTAIRRNVEWLNEGLPILREYCSSGLTSRLKYQGTCVSATDLLDHIKQALEDFNKGNPPTFKHQLHGEIKGKIAELLVSNQAFLNDRKFEELVRQLMLALGATSSEIPSKAMYGMSKADVDIIADFIHLGLQIYVQVKKHHGTSDETAVQQIIEALKIDNPDGTKPILGWVINSASFSEKAESLANANGIRVINGDELAEMILSVGLDHF